MRHALVYICKHNVQKLMYMIKSFYDFKIILTIHVHIYFKHSNVYYGRCKPFELVHIDIFEIKERKKLEKKID